ncbi:MAG: hypothetical protein AAF389_13415 [Gemmatimonadota bacterium]
MACARESYVAHGIWYPPAEAEAWGGKAPSPECDEHKRRVIDRLTGLYEQSDPAGEVGFESLRELDRALLALGKRCGRTF